MVYVIITYNKRKQGEWGHFMEEKRPRFNKRHVWLVIFLLIILYAVSSINVLILALGILPYLEDAFLEANILVYFAITSFIITAFLCLYHITIMFQKRKRKTDVIGYEEQQESMGFKKMWKRSRPITKFIFIFICVYAVASVYMLLWAYGIANTVLITEYDVTWIGYSLVSFGTATIIAAYHLSTWILRQKRASDHTAGVGAGVGVTVDTNTN
jgi:membrane protein implicated in regulation of membrane protease activity